MCLCWQSDRLRLLLTMFRCICVAKLPFRVGPGSGDLVCHTIGWTKGTPFISHSRNRCLLGFYQWFWATILSNHIFIFETCLVHFVLIEALNSTDIIYLLLLFIMSCYIISTSWIQMLMTFSKNLFKIIGEWYTKWGQWNTLKDFCAVSTRSIKIRTIGCNTVPHSSMTIYTSTYLNQERHGSR